MIQHGVVEEAKSFHPDLTGAVLEELYPKASWTMGLLFPVSFL